MRFLHTADWHLGRLFHGQSLLEDQVPLLDQVLEIAHAGAVDAILIAGDVFDRAVPPAEAVALFDDFLCRAALDLGVAVVAIAGNHDSGERLGFGARLLAGSRVHVVGSLDATREGIAFADAHGEVRVHALPYADPAMTRHALARDDLRDHDAAMGALVEGIRARHPKGARAVLLGHAFVAGGEVSESERTLSVGGTGQVGAARFAGFDYVALGHLHRPQRVGSDVVRYAGSLAKYSFSEVGHEKSVSLVELGARGAPDAVVVERVGLHPGRDVRRIEGELAALLAEAPAAGRDDYLCVTLRDMGALLDPLGRLRAIYPNVMQIDRPHLGAAPGAGLSVEEQRARTPHQLFAEFFEQVEGRALGEAERAAYAEAASEARRIEREEAGP